MASTRLLKYLLLTLALTFGILNISYAQQSGLSAAEVVNRNVAARGGLEAWRAVQTLSMTGKMEAGGNNRPATPQPGLRRGQKVTPPRPIAQVELPFKMDLKRTRKQRLEIEFNGQTSVQLYDGVNGWKLRPYLNRSDYEPYTADEEKVASEQSDLDGPLVDYAAKGTTVQLAGSEIVDARDNYKLKLTLKNGYSFHVWIDAQTFLETKMEGAPRRLDGQYRPVEIYLRDYRTVNGLRIPAVLETRVNTTASVGVHGGKQTQQQWTSEKITIDEVSVNPRLDDSLFSKPKSEVAATSSTRTAADGSSIHR